MEKVLGILGNSNVEDSWIRKTYAEYITASELAKIDYNVQIGTERIVRALVEYSCKSLKKKGKKLLDCLTSYQHYVESAEQKND